MRDSDEFHSNPMGTFVDPALVAAAAAEGAGLPEIHRRAKAKEFSPDAAPVEIPYAE